MQYRATFALDEATIRRLRRLSKVWRVSQAEAVRRAVEIAEREAAESEAGPLERLAAYHDAGGMDARAGKAYLEEVAEGRSVWGQGG